MVSAMRWLDRLRGLRVEPQAALDPAAQMDSALVAANAGDYETALALWEPLARSGHARAQNNIGACFAEGLGVAVNRPLALKWLRLAAEAGDPVGERNYAAFHMRGLDGTDPDYTIAGRFYRQAAEQGDAPAQDMLSWMLLEGEVMAYDAEEALQWARKAADAGIASSMTRLGLLYHNAIGVERDAVQAVHWWSLGAGKDDADAQAMLGAALHMGAGIERDGIAALAWLLRAMNAGSDLARPFLTPVRESLSRDQSVEAERRSRLPLGEMIAEVKAQ
jgi:TPR repeat protein